MGFSAFEEKLLINDTLYISDGEGTGSQTITNNTQLPTRIDAMFVKSTSATDHVLEVGAFEGGRSHPMARINIPAGAGTGIVPLVEVVAAEAPPAIGAFLITPNYVFYAKVDVALSSGEEITAVIIGGTF